MTRSRKQIDQPGSGPSRREFMRGALGGAAALGLTGLPAIGSPKPSADRVIVLGLDGMDPFLTSRYVKEGLMPNCRRLIETGSFQPLGTSDPPQSPVAWSNFITGTNPGGHGIFDFIARDAATRVPYLSTSKTIPAEKSLRIGGWNIPVSSGKVLNLRKGPTFWNDLRREGHDCTVFRVPSNFPPAQSDIRSLSGMGTPDLHGSYGIFSYYTTEDLPELMGQDEAGVRGGHLRKVVVKNGVVEDAVRGPVNSFASDERRSEVPFKAFVDHASRLAKFVIQDHEFILREGEWSGWKNLRFPMLPHLASISGICRFYLKEAHEGLSLYVTPINIDPAAPSVPISTPSSYSRDLAEELGYFYTQGMPEDTAALTAGALNDDEYRQQATFVLNERMRAYEHELGRFSKGFFFFYFSSLDLNSHAFWRVLDREHPLHSPELVKRHGDFLPWLYAEMDRVVGQAMELVDERTLLLGISDHGFASFRRQFHLNSWLMEEGYAVPRDPYVRGEAELFEEAKWSETRAYGLGINGLYLNVRGREPDGTVAPGDAAEELKEELITRLESLEDPKTGEKVVSRVCRPEEIYSGPYVHEGPDLLVAYNRNFRSSKKSILGGYPEEILQDNLDPWSGDHCMDSRFLPGVCISNRELTSQRPELSDLAPTILSAFGVPKPQGMTGSSVLGT